MLKAMRLDALARFEDADFPQMRVLGRDAAEIVPIAGDDTRDLDRRSRNGRMPPGRFRAIAAARSPLERGHGRR